MKKFFLFLTTLLITSATQAALHVYAFPIDSTLTEDTYMRCSEFEEDIFGDLSAEVRLRVFSDDATHITVKINRSNTLFLDNFCAGQNCMGSNEELEQNLEYDIVSVDQREVYIHCYAYKEGAETISYTFSDGVNPEITLTIEFVYQTAIPASFPRKFLMEQFTGRSCPNCPNGILAINVVFRLNPDKYIWVAHHTYTPDPLLISDSRKIASAIGVSGAPFVSINRNYQLLGSQKKRWFHPAYMLEESFQLLDSATSPVSVLIDREYNPETRELSITVHGQVADTNITKIRLSALIKENALAGQQADYYFAWDGAWKEYLHMAAPRAFCSEALGDEVAVTNQAYSKTYKAEVDNTWLENNCTIVAFAANINAEGKDIYNVEEVPLVEGTTGGNDCISYGITQNAAPNTTLVFPQILVQQHATDSILQLMLLSNQNMRSTAQNFYYGSCRPVLLLNVITTEKQLQSGTYPILDDLSYGSTIAGFRADTAGMLGGSLLIYASAQYLQSYQIVPGARWRLQSGTVTVDKDGFMSVSATTYNGSQIECTCTASTLTALEQVKPEVENNTIYNILGQPFDQDPTQLPQGVYIQNGRKFIKR